LTATALSALGLSFFLIEPRYSFLIASREAAAGLALFVVVGSIISLLVGHLGEALVSAARAEEALRRKAELVDLSHDAVVTADSSRRITGWNAGAVEMYGWTESEALGHVIHDLLQTSHSTSTAEIDEALHRQGRWDGELNHIARDGRRLIVDSRQVLVRDEKDRPADFLEINRDVTARKHAEEELRRTGEQCRLALESANMGSWDLHVSSGLVSRDERARMLLGIPAAEMETFRGTLDTIHADDRSRVADVVQGALDPASRGSLDVEFRVVWPDGSVHWVFSKGTASFEGEGAARHAVRLTGTIQDITARRRADEALWEVSEQRRLALEAANLGAWDYRFDTGDVFWDERCRNMWGVTADLAYAYDGAISRIHPDDRAATDEAVKQALAGANGGAYHREFRVVWPDGSVHWVSSHGRVSFADDPESRRAVRFVGVNMDITERRQAEERLRQAQKLESIGLLAGGVAHDFNNILTVIMGNASAALAECPSCEYCRSIVSASERAAYLTQQLLAYAGKGQTALKIVDLTERVSLATSLLSASVPKRVTLRFNLAKNLPYLEADPSQIDQILMNLAINSGESIPARSDGLIEITTSSCEVTPEVARQHSREYEVAAGAYVCLEVRDNGAGMDQATIPRVFDPFFTTKFTGRGLGLAAVHGIVRANKGFIDVHSSPAAGATFRVFLPASAKTRSKVPAPGSPPPRQHRGSATVLVVDDEEMVRNLACMALRRRGYEVLEATDGKDALQLLASSPSRPSVVLLDLAMPVMGGDELAPILEEKYPGLKIVISSGYPEEDARKDFRQGSIAGFLQKPYTPLTLTEKIEVALGDGSIPK
jgi:PAS domain S-box-containing protein